MEGVSRQSLSASSADFRLDLCILEICAATSPLCRMRTLTLSFSRWLRTSPCSMTTVSVPSPKSIRTTKIRFSRTTRRYLYSFHTIPLRWDSFFKGTPLVPTMPDGLRIDPSGMFAADRGYRGVVEACFRSGLARFYGGLFR